MKSKILLQKINSYSPDHIEKFVGELDLKEYIVPDFKLATYPIDITFNPLRLAKSFLKPFYEVGIKEKLVKEF